ncbi:hypothetical protein BDY21DRAFT_351822 [Lineolata rhizophorae]|uniref:Ino eighty subunit 1 n=1 Tax=Lineolata rhizophorae TaxID=578093 RepID=A0A6A6NST9_9PEZI|nr:hypothetical protein BDY21DRAFT_351822 [Lineolata rhizophorae]
MYTATTTTTRRNANGSVSSVYSGNKIRHLKKEDGVPLWRNDIQYDFLRYVFEDDKKVFHKISDGTGGHTFADIYLDAMAKSSKCSKILKDKLLTERAAAINMAMVCLLVNVGRMNTTLNFFPEMRAQLRTYHSIPSLQAHQDPNAYKQLQDAPRLKSILKGATEDTEQPSTIEEIMSHPIPRTNPVNLIFVLAQYAPKISEIHFFPPRDFFDLVMRQALSSRSRATAFLWLMWWYLESNFAYEDAVSNPFGPGQPGLAGDATEGLPVKVPTLRALSEAEMKLENVDTDEELSFGEAKQKERAAILASDTAPIVSGPKRGGMKKAYNSNPIFSVTGSDEGASSRTPGQSPAPSRQSGAGGRGGRSGKTAFVEYPSDTDNTRSVSPPFGSARGGTGTPGGMRINTLLNDDTPSAAPAPTRPGRGNWRRAGGRGGLKHKLDTAHSASSPGGVGEGSSIGFGGIGVSSTGPHGFYLPLNGADPTAVHKRSRPLTTHQLAVEKYRKERVEYILDRQLRRDHEKARRRRLREGAFARSWRRLKALPDGYDSEEELLAMGGVLNGTEDQAAMFAAHGGKGYLGFAGVGTSATELGERKDDGEEACAYTSAVRRVGRRLNRWGGGGLVARKVKRDKGAPGGGAIAIEWVGDSGAQKVRKKRKVEKDGEEDEGDEAEAEAEAEMEAEAEAEAERDADVDMDGDGDGEGEGDEAEGGQDAKVPIKAIVDEDADMPDADEEAESDFSDQDEDAKMDHASNSLKRGPSARAAAAS